MTSPGAPGQDGWYPQQEYYAPGWSGPAGAPPPRPRTGRWVAVGVTVLVALALVAWGVVALLTFLGTRPLGEVTAPASANARQLGVGHCLESLPEDGDVDRVTVVPCTEPHEAEVVGQRRLDDGDWPGTRDVRREVAAGCEMATVQVEAGHRAVVWAPSEASWGQGDRVGLCLAWAPDGPVVGSWSLGEQVAPAG